MKEEDVVEEIYSKYGSIYGCKRRNIEIKSIVEKKGTCKWQARKKQSEDLVQN